MITAKDVLVRQLEQAYDKRAWHGTNLLGSLRDVEGAMRTWRPQDGRHNIAELAVHAAYWKYRVYRLISGDTTRFALDGSDFFERSHPQTEEQWRSDIALLQASHDRLVEAAVSCPDNRLHLAPGSAKFSFHELISGAAAHDLYHAGQIQLIKRLFESR
jgi:hypothetical protein